MAKAKTRGTPEANPERGEHELVLAGRTYRLRPSHAAIVAIERKTGESLLALVRLANGGGLTIAQLGMIGAELIRAGADEADAMTRAVDAARIGELIFEEGIGRVVPRLLFCLVDAASGGCTVSGEAKAAPAATTPSAGAASPA